MFPAQEGAAGGDGWNDAGWGEAEDWFAGVQQPDQQPQEHFVEEPQLQEAAAQDQVRHQQQEQDLRAHQEELAALRDQVTIL
jgi:hypothetical protein